MLIKCSFMYIKFMQLQYKATVINYIYFNGNPGGPKLWHRPSSNLGIPFIAEKVLMVLPVMERALAIISVTMTIIKGVILQHTRVLH